MLNNSSSYRLRLDGKLFRREEILAKLVKIVGTNLSLYQLSFTVGSIFKS